MKHNISKSIALISPAYKTSNEDNPGVTGFQGLFVQSFMTWAEEHKQGELIKVSFKRKKEKPLTRRYLKYNTVITFKENVVAGIKEK